jgi:hypothetical protein
MDNEKNFRIIFVGMFMNKKNSRTLAFYSFLRSSVLESSRSGRSKRPRIYTEIISYRSNIDYLNL